MSDENVYHCITDGIAFSSYDCIYLGSEFCWEKIDVNLDWNSLIKLCHKEGFMVFFVFPILPERFDRTFILLFEKLIKGGIDGIVANDLGVLYYVYQQKPSLPKVLGRLLVKSSRDYILPHHGINKLRFPLEILQICDIFNCIRIDSDFKLLSEEDKKKVNIEIGIHSVSYLTSSMCCDYKFDKDTRFSKINSNCRCECYKEALMVPGSTLIKVGNALLFFRDDDTILLDDRIIVDFKCNQIRTSV